MNTRYTMVDSWNYYFSQRQAICAMQQALWYYRLQTTLSRRVVIAVERDRIAVSIIIPLLYTEGSRLPLFNERSRLQDFQILAITFFNINFGKISTMQPLHSYTDKRNT